MMWLIASAAALALVIGTIMLCGSRLPKEHVAAQRVTLQASPERVFAVVSRFEDAPQWRKDVKTVDLLEGGDVFVEHGPHGKIRMRVVEREPARRLVTTIDDESLPFGGAWTYEIEAVAEGTRVTITERGVVKPAFFRFLSKYVFTHEKTLREYLEQLARHLGEQVTVEAA
jgi:uncharacterized protein YndB with AHSA1/START domain